jgi:hypothetical protein
MKTKSIFVAALLVVVAAMSAIGKNEPGVTGMAVVASQGSEVVKVIYVGETSGKVKLTIYNDASQVVFSETRNTDGFIRPLNFSGLAYGEYSIELTDASGTKVEKINYQPSTSPTHFHVSQINNEGRFLLSIARTSNSDINVKIYDAQNKLVHNADKVVSKDLAELYSIKEFRGTCTFVVSNGAGETEIFNFHRSF